MASTGESRFSDKTKTADTRVSNILAAKAVSDAVRTSLGPKGMDKMIVQESKSDVLISNDGATILNRIRVEHPTAKMLVELSRAQDVAAGDGTTSVVVLAGALLKASENLLQLGIHPQVISDAFMKIAIGCSQFLKEKVAHSVDLANEEQLIDAAKTSLSSKIISSASDLLAPMAVTAVKRVAETFNDGSLNVDFNRIRIIQKLGGTIDDSELVEGLALENRVARVAGGPSNISKAKIGIVQFCLSPPKPDMENHISIKDYSSMDRILREERNYLVKMVKKIAKTGCNVLLVQKSILRDSVTNLSLDFLAKAKILVVRDVERSDVEQISSVLGAEPVSDIEFFTADKLGSCDHVCEDSLDGASSGSIVRFTGIQGGSKQIVSILLRGSSGLILDEAERSLHDALCVIRSLVKLPFLVPGGGCPEMALATQIRTGRLPGISNIYPRILEEYADALEIIPYTLAENGGMRPVDVVVSLRNAHAKTDKHRAGICFKTNKVADLIENESVVMPLLVSDSMIRLSTETVRMILKIDDNVFCR